MRDGRAFVAALEAYLDARDQLQRTRGLRKYEPEAREIFRRAGRNLAAAAEGRSPRPETAKRDEFPPWTA